MNTQKLLIDLTSLYSAVVCDVLDQLGYRDQALPNTIRPLTLCHFIAGRVYTASGITVNTMPEKAYELEIKAVETLKKDDVLVIDAGYDNRCGLWGELLTTACEVKGVKGVIMTACTRDLWKIKDMDFPVFGIGFHPADSLGRMDITSIGEPISIDGISIKTADNIIGDEDGIVIIPARVVQEVIRLAKEKQSVENIVRDELAKGVPVGEVFEKYRIL